MRDNAGFFEKKMFGLKMTKIGFFEVIEKIVHEFFSAFGL